MDVAYRPAGPEDLVPAMRVVEQAHNELRGRHRLRPVGLREPAFQPSCAKTRPKATRPRGNRT
jgi:hypothetical protein